MPQPALATPEDAAAWGYDLPSDTASALLSRASVRIRRAAKHPIAPPATITLELPVTGSEIALPVHPVIAVLKVQTVADDGTLTTLTGWRWNGDRLEVPCPWPVLGLKPPRASVQWQAGFPVASDGIVELTCQVATRLSMTPAGMDVGIRERKVDDYSETYAVEQLDIAGDLLPGEEKALRRELGVLQVWTTSA
jgi:hypothetical protein